MEENQNTKKYRITIEEVTQYDETTTAYANPEKPGKIYNSKYEVESDAEREKLLSHKRPTGRRLEESKKVFEQTVDSEGFELHEVIRAINALQ